MADWYPSVGGTSASLPRAFGVVSTGGDASPRAVCEDGATYSTCTVRRLVSRVVFGFSEGAWLIASRFVWRPPGAVGAVCGFVGSRTEALLASEGCGSNVSSVAMSAHVCLLTHEHESLLE